MSSFFRRVDFFFDPPDFFPVLEFLPGLDFFLDADFLPALAQGLEAVPRRGFFFFPREEEDEDFERFFAITASPILAKKIDVKTSENLASPPLNGLLITVCYFVADATAFFFAAASDRFLNSS